MGKMSRMTSIHPTRKIDGSYLLLKFGGDACHGEGKRCEQLRITLHDQIDGVGSLMGSPPSVFKFVVSLPKIFPTYDREGPIRMHIRPAIP
jgi:hypothetical protein